MTLQPSPLAMVPFVSVARMMALVNRIGVARMIAQIANAIEEDFARWEQFDKVPRIAAHSEEGVIELMPTSDGSTYGFKYVNGHPANMARGFQTVTAFGLLAKVDTGYPILLSEMTLLTALRTAAMSVVAAKYLAPKNARCMAMIGNGAQCEFQALGFQSMLGIDEIRLYDIDPLATAKAKVNLENRGLRIVCCGSAQEAVTGAQIITTCTADKQYATILTDNMVGAGQHLNAIGGDCPGKTELHHDVLWRVIAGQIPGRTSDREITLFDSVGFATEDFSALRVVYDLVRESGEFDALDMIADPDDTRDLFGMLQRSKGA